MLLPGSSVLVECRKTCGHPSQDFGVPGNLSGFHLTKEDPSPSLTRGLIGRSVSLLDLNRSAHLVVDRPDRSVFPDFHPGVADRSPGRSGCWSADRQRLALDFGEWVHQVGSGPFDLPFPFVRTRGLLLILVSRHLLRISLVSRISPLASCHALVFLVFVHS